MATTGTLKIYRASEHFIDGNVVLGGSLQTPIGEVTTSGSTANTKRRVKIDSGDTYEVYNWIRDGDFEAFGFNVIGEGYLRGAEITDIPTSTTDLAPAGTGQRASAFEVSNVTGKWWDTDQVRTEPTATVSKTYSLTGYSTSTGTGTPDLFASTTDVDGKIYSIKLFNPATEDLDDDGNDLNAVTIEIEIHN